MKNITRLATQHWPDPSQPPLFVFDNNSIQKHSCNANCNMSWNQRVKIPQHSPDFNKPIEHTFHRLKEMLREDYLSGNQVLTAQEVQEWVRDIFENRLLEEDWRDSIKNDVYSLRKTWLAVSTAKGVRVRASDGTIIRGSGGDWPASHLR